ncbi:MAG: DUF4058 family protein [Caldilineaceae bacterium]|nr:DUF4058 family protein [Caldilineaceae bacterium]
MITESPFPGMDPYTEARYLWKGIHTQLIGELSTHLLPPLLAPAYYVDVEPSLQVRSGQSLFPNLQVLTTHRNPSQRPTGWAMPVAEATMELTTVPELEEDEEESAIYIREAASEQLVTVIEILSYSNKTRGIDKYARYMAKRRDVLKSGVHLVEIDLLRWGQRVAEPLPNRPYHILITRADEQPQGRVWSFEMVDVIPTVPLPLLAYNEYVPLPLQAAYSTIYQARNFRNRLDYTVDPEPPLTAEQQQFIREQLLAAQLRPPTNEM